MTMMTEKGGTVKENKGTVLRWQTPSLPHRAPPDRLAKIIDALHDRPYEWALVKECYPNSGWGTIYPRIHQHVERAIRIRHDVLHTPEWILRHYDSTMIRRLGYPRPTWDIYLRYNPPSTLPPPDGWGSTT